MSDIPRARAILQKALDCDIGNERMLRHCIRQALALLDRERPEFTAPRKLPTLTTEHVELARKLRAEGKPVNEIARKLGTNIGRVSEAINGKRNGETQPAARRAYRVNEFCQAYRVSRDTAYRLMKNGKLQYFTVGTERRISVEAAEALGRSDPPFEVDV